MMKPIKLIPKRLTGQVQVPPSKSIAHRAILCAALAGGGSRVDNLALSDDIQATLRGMRALGADLTVEKGTLCAGDRHRPTGEAVVDCGESGSTLRFLLPVFLALGIPARFTGRGRLFERPLDPYFELMRAQNISFKQQPGQPNLSVAGRLQAGNYRIPGNVSSQFITGLLFALPLLSNDCLITVEGELESRGYIDLTLDCLEQFGIQINRDGYRTFQIPGGQQFHPASLTVEGDYSQAAFFLAAGALGSQVAVKGLRADSHQGDRAVLDLLCQMGCTIEWSQGSVTCQGTKLKATVIDASQCPDVIPIVAAVTALAEGRTEIIHAGRLRIKECDRLSAIAQELNRLGGRVFEHADSLTIEGVSEFEGGCVASSHADHRMAMTLAIAATRCRRPFTLDDRLCVAKSYQNFFEDYLMLGGEYHEFNVGQSL